MIKFNSIHLFICSFFFIVLFSSCSHDSIDTSVSRLKDTDVVELTQTPETNFTVSNGTLSKYLKLFYKGKAIDKVDFLLRAMNMIAKMDELGFGTCTNTRACEMECPKHVSISHIARLNREFLKGYLKK